jgi:hypothetical protein
MAWNRVEGSMTASPCFDPPSPGRYHTAMALWKPSMPAVKVDKSESYLITTLQSNPSPHSLPSNDSPIHRCRIRHLSGRGPHCTSSGPTSVEDSSTCHISACISKRACSVDLEPTRCHSPGSCACPCATKSAARPRVWYSEPFRLWQSRRPTPIHQTCDQDHPGLFYIIWLS